MLSREGRSQYSLEEVRALLADAKVELGALAQSVLREPNQCARGRARLLLSGDGSQLVLEESEQGYRITEAFGTGAEARTPAQVLAELGRALEALDLPRILNLLSSERKDELEEKLTRLARTLQHSGQARIETTISGYLVTLPDGTRIELLLEREGYRIGRIQ